MPAGLRHDAGVATFAAGLRTPFARYWLSGFLADFGDGVRLAAFPLLAAQLTRSPAATGARVSHCCGRAAPASAGRSA